MPGAWPTCNASAGFRVADPPAGVGAATRISEANPLPRPLHFIRAALELIALQLVALELIALPMLALQLVAIPLLALELIALPLLALDLVAARLVEPDQHALRVAGRRGRRRRRVFLRVGAAHAERQAQHRYRGGDRRALGGSVSHGGPPVSRRASRGAAASARPNRRGRSVRSRLPTRRAGYRYRASPGRPRRRPRPARERRRRGPASRNRRQRRR